MTPSPTDIQERETIARIIDPGKRRVLDTELERVKRHHPNGGYDPDNFKDRASLAKADAILALRSNPQPGSEGLETGWLIEHRDDKRTEWLTLKPSDALFGLVWTTNSDEAIRFARRDDAEDYYATHIDDAPNTFITEHQWRAASPTPPTAQPGEVERLRWFSGQTSLELSFGYEDEAGDHVGAWQVHRRSGNINDREWDLIGQGETVAEAIDIARAALTPSESQEAG